jgi:hypothetical protein
MKIKLIRSTHVNGYTGLLAGATVDVPNDVADYLLVRGRAVRVIDVSPVAIESREPVAIENRDPVQMPQRKSSGRTAPK